MKSRFQLDADCVGPSPTLIDPEAFDVSEQQFAASLEEKPGQTRPQFVMEGDSAGGRSAEADGSTPGVDEEAPAGGEDARGAELSPGEACEAAGPEAWRREVAARVNRYRGKRPRPPRYPSLQLSFDSSEPSLVRPPSPSVAVTSVGQLAITMEPEAAPEAEPQAASTEELQPITALDGGSKILEFPRSSFMPPVAIDELAGPVFDRPRILEVPEVLPPPPALGGILIESAEAPKDERRVGFELPLKAAQLTRRILAGLTDGLLVMAALAAFAYIFFRITSIMPPLRQGAEVAAGLLAALWAAYQYLLLVYAGSTPGLKLAKLELSRFDGRPVPRKLRRWRVLASVLSGMSLALGYAWCFMDEDELCWHDRITHTYMAPKAVKASSSTVPK